MKPLKLIITISLLSLISEIEAAEHDTSHTWSDQKIKNLIGCINNIPKDKPLTDKDIENYESITQAAQRGILERIHLYNIKITSLPQEILQRQDDTAATWLFIMINNGYTHFIPQLKSLASSNSCAQGFLGDCYFEGIGLKKNFSEAFRWMHSAADQGDARARYSLGVLYYKGEYVERNTLMAFRWFRLAADQGESRAQANLGFCYELGTSTKKDLLKAIRLYLSASKNGISHKRFDFNDFLRWRIAQDAQLPSKVEEMINKLNSLLGSLRGDTIYWIALSKNTSFKDSFSLMPSLKFKANFLDEFYKSMVDLLPLLTDPEFAITCFKINDEQLQQNIADYGTSGGKYFSFNLSYNAFQKNYESKLNTATNYLREMIEFFEETSRMVNLSPAGVERFLKELDPESLQFIEPLFHHYLKASTPEEQNQARSHIKNFVDNSLEQLENHLNFMTAESEDFSNTSSFFGFFKKILGVKSHSPVGFKEIFEGIIEQSAPYRNYLFLKKYNID